MPRTLAIDCATEACSAALFEDGTLLDGRYEILGRGHAERLVPMIAELPGKGRAERVIVSLGPGSFTGVRIGLATARALGLAWHAEVRGYPTLHLVAAMAQAEIPGEPVSVCMSGGHGEYFLQNFAAGGAPEGELHSLRPDAAAATCRHRVIAGSKARAVADLIDRPCETLDLLPDARQAHLLMDRDLLTELAPLYGRPPDATLPGERR